MIEETVLKYLTDKLDVPVYLEVPAKNVPDRFVVLEKTAGGIENFIQSATVAIQSYGESLYQAAVLNEKVKTAMLEIEGLPNISRCDLNTDYNFTDTETKRYRYQAVYDFIYY